MKNSRKTFYIANFILLFSVLVLSFVIAMVIMYNDQKNFATEKTDVLTEQVYNEVENVLDRLNTTSRAMFLDENFQNLTEKIYTDDQAILRMFGHFDIFLSMDKYFANAIYVPRNSLGQIDSDFYLNYNPGLDYVPEILPQILQMAELPEYARGEAFFVKLYYADGIYTQHCALVRNVIDIRQGSYFQKMGIGILVFNSSICTDILNNYASAFDGLEFYLTDGQSIPLNSKNFSAQTEGKSNHYSKRFLLNHFSWNLVGVFDKKYIWTAMQDSFIVLVVSTVISGAFCVMLALLLKRKTSKSLDYLFNTFSRFKKDNVIEIIPHSQDEEVNQVIDSFNEMVNSVKTLNDQMLKQKNRELALELRNVEYMLNSLHSQINKHFMINVLALLRSFIYCGELDRAKKCIEDLSDFLRSALTIDDTGTIGEELSMVRSYLSLQTSRYPNIEVEIDCNEQYYNVVIPKMILQPIIENAFIHGLQKKSGKIKLVCKLRAHYVTFFVIDNGLGMDAKKVREINLDLRENKKKDLKIGNGIALHNIKQRLRLIASQKSSMKVFSKKGQGTIVVVKIYRGE